jgi:predicted acetyltransferase
MEEIIISTNEDKTRLIEFNELVHSGNIEYHIENLIFKNPFNSIKNFAYIEIDGKIAAMVGFLKYKQQFGNKEINVGEITYVGTHPDYRKRGLCKKLMNYWIDYAKVNKITLCFLYGIGNFYEQFGFEYAVPAHFYSYVNIKKELLKDLKGIYNTEKLQLSKEKYIEEIKTIYDKSSKENFCSRVRSLEYFQYRIKSTNKGEHCWYVVLKGEQVKGYIWLSLINSKIIVREAEIVDDEGGKSLCEFIYSLISKNEEIKAIGMRLPLNNSFAKFLYKKGAQFSCTSEIYPSNWAGMYKIIDLKSALGNLVPSFEKRLYKSRFYDYSINFNITTEIGKVGINIQNGKVRITNYVETSIEINIPIYILTSIFTGYKDICYYENELNFKNRELYDIFKTLFPYCNPYIWDLEMSDEL